MAIFLTGQSRIIVQAITGADGRRHGTRMLAAAAPSGGGRSGVGIGGDPIIGPARVDCLRAFQDDPETDAIVMIGEIGGDAEERAAAFIERNVSKPVVAYVAGFTAPEGRTMGHAGAIISGSAGTAQ